MKREIVLATVLLLSGCNTLRKFWPIEPGQDKPGTSTPDVYTVSGKTTGDHDTVLIRTLDSSIHPTVKIPGDTDYRELNQYEYQISTQGVPGAIIFGRVVKFAVDMKTGKLEYLVIYNIPSAPAGSEYVIQSALNKVDKNLY